MGSGRKPKFDYREVLSAKDFSIFSKLRDLRKQLASEEALPVYEVFTNEQLAAFVTNKVSSKSELQKISGVGDAKAQKYGERIIELLNNQLQQSISID